MGEYPRVAGVVTKQGNDISELVNSVADEHGFPPRLLVACGIQESNLDEQSERRAAWPDVSAGIWHQTVLYAVGFGLGDGTRSPENIATVFDALKTDTPRAARIAASQLGHWWGRYGDGPESLGRYNWPARGLQDNPNRANIERGWRESARYVVEEAPVAQPFDPDTSPERQQQDWTCSIRTATWLLRSLGIDVTAAQMQDEMVAAGLVTPALGLLDGSGAALAAWLGERFGLTVHVEPDISWERACELAGTVPLALGSASLYHWLAVRKPEGDGLALMNPAPGYQGLGDYMTAEEFTRWSPWNAIWIETEAAPENGDDMADAALIARLGYLQGDVADAIESAIQDARTAPRKAARDEYLDAALAAVATLRRGGAPEEE